MFYDLEGEIDPSHKSHYALDIYPTMHHFVTEMCTQVHIAVTTEMMHCGIWDWCIMGFVNLVYSDMSFFAKWVNYDTPNTLMILSPFH